MPLTSQQIDDLRKYHDLLVKFNKKINLVSSKDIQNLYERHIMDGVNSYLVFKSIKRISSGYSIYDLGSGNGIPGIVWAILDHSTSFKLVEIDSRKAEFLKYAAHSLGMTHVDVYCNDYNDLYPSPSDIHICRAFTEIRKLLLPENAFTQNEGFFLKSSTWNNEIEGLEAYKFTQHPYSIEGNKELFLVHYSPKAIL